MGINKYIIIIIYLLMLITSIGFYLTIPLEYNELRLELIIISVLFVLVLFFVRRETNRNIKGNLFRPVILFIISYVIVHFQVYVDIILENIPEIDSFMVVDKSIICKAGLLSLTGLLSFLIGYLMLKSRVRVQRYYNHKFCNIKFLIVLLYIFILLFIYSAGAKFIFGGYGTESISGTMAAYAIILVQLIVNTIFIINSLNYKIYYNNISLISYVKSFGILFHIPVIIYCFVVLMSGDRGPIISIAVGFLFSYVIAAKQKLKLPLFVAILFAGSASLTILGLARRFQEDKLFLHEKIELALTEDRIIAYNSISNNTIELAASVRTLHHAMITVPNIHEYLYGKFQLRYISLVIPFSSRITDKIFDEGIKYYSSADFITWIEQGDFASSGTGTTCIADLYIDLGLIGVILGMFLFGLFIRYIETKIIGQNNTSLFNYTLCIYTMTVIYYIPRSSILYSLFGFVWLYTVLRIYLYLNKKRKKRAIT